MKKSNLFQQKYFWDQLKKKNTSKNELNLNKLKKQNRLNLVKKMFVKLSYKSP